MKFDAGDLGSGGYVGQQRRAGYRVARIDVRHEDLVRLLEGHDHGTGLQLATSLAQYTTAWNTPAEPFVAGTPTQIFQEMKWVTSGATNLAAMEQAAVGLRSGVVKIHDRQLGSMLMSISDNYQVKLLAAKALVRAVETSNDDAQSAASEQLRAAGLAVETLHWI